MKAIKVVFDTNVIYSGLLSKKGVSYKLLKLIPKGIFKLSLSVPLLLEYETILLRNLRKLNLTKVDIDDFLDYLCSVSDLTKIYYLWRPILKDPYDDHILELAVASSSKYIITYNIKDFTESKYFNIKTITPDEFIKIL